MMEENCSSAAAGIAVRPARVSGVWRGGPRRRLAGYFTYVAILSLAACGPFIELGRYALKEELHSHILLIPFVSLYLAALKREELGRAQSGSVAGAVAGTVGFVVAAVAVYLGYAMAGAQDLERHDEMVRTGACYALLLVAGGFLFLGTSWMRRLAFPFGLLVFMVPLPGFVVAGLEGFLMRASAVVADWFFQWTGTPVFRNGQVIEVPGTTLAVARNCSGIRSTLVLFITSLIASYLFLSSFWHRGLLVAMVVPLGILRNALRVLVIGLLCVHVGPEMIESWVHRHGGPLFFAASLVPLLAVAAWFRYRERRS